MVDELTVECLFPTATVIKLNIGISANVDIAHRPPGELRSPIHVDGVDSFPQSDQPY